MNSFWMIRGAAQEWLAQDKPLPTLLRKMLLTGVVLGYGVIFLAWLFLHP